MHALALSLLLAAGLDEATAKSLPLTPAASLQWATRLADSEMKRRGRSLESGQFDPESKRPARLDYTTGLLMDGYLDLWRRTEDKRYLQYARDVMGSFIDKDGNIAGYSRDEYNIDWVNPGKAALALFVATGEERYRKAADLLREQMRTHPRTKAGGFWHKKRYPWQMWLDGLYMGPTFLARYAKRFDEPKASFDDIVLQFVLVEEKTRDPKTGLLHHAWDEAKAQDWANKETGRSPHIWGRAIGWYAMALVDTLEVLPADHPGRAQLRAILGRLATAMAACQDKSGRWWQVVDQGGREGNYLESSVTAMLAYAFAKGVNRGFLDAKYGTVAIKAYEGLVRDALEAKPDGAVNLTAICQVAGLGYGRDGSYKYYLSEPVVPNDPKGVGPFLMAGIEIEALLKAR
jgi:unsaturated rhamnogalacturonyl hydrolase